MGRPKGSKNKKPNRVNDCHPEREHCAKGLCLECYNREGCKSRDKAKHCLSTRIWQSKNKEKIAASKKIRYDRDRIKILKQKSEYWTENRIRIAARKFGLSEEEIIKIPPKPDKCTRCPRTWKICLDHDHATGKFRGWLCGKCNTILGLADDDISILENLISYLKETR